MDEHFGKANYLQQTITVTDASNSRNQVSQPNLTANLPVPEFCRFSFLRKSGKTRLFGAGTTFVFWDATS